MSDSRPHDPADALARMARGEGSDDDDGDAADDPAASATSDELLAAPAPDPSVFAPRHTTRELRADAQIRSRRTVIPILLTCGVLMPAVGALKWVRGPESPFSAWPLWAPIALAACGVVLLLLAVANMLQVRQMTRDAAKRRSEPAAPRPTLR